MIRIDVPDAVVFTEQMGRLLVADGLVSDATIREASEAAARIAGGLYWSDRERRILVFDYRQLL